MKKQQTPVFENLIHPTAESTTLAAMRDDTDVAMQLVSILDAADFASDKHKLVFLAIKNLLNSVEAIDAHTIAAECAVVAREHKIAAIVHADFISGLVGDARRAIAYAATVKRMAWLRSAGDFAYWLIDELKDNPAPDDIFTAAQERLQTLAPRTDRGATMYGWETIDSHRAAVKERRLEAESGLTRRFDWPWASWNQWVRPLRSGLVGVLAAPDGVGKSTYLEWIAEHWAKRSNKVVMVHLEDDHQYKLDRRMARHSSVPLSAIEDGNLTPQHVASITEAERQMSEWVDYLHYTHAPGWSMSDIIKELQKMSLMIFC